MVREKQANGKHRWVYAKNQSNKMVSSGLEVGKVRPDAQPGLRPDDVPKNIGRTRRAELFPEQEDDHRSRRSVRMYHTMGAALCHCAC